MKQRYCLLAGCLTGLGWFVLLIIIWAVTHPVYLLPDYPYWQPYSFEQILPIGGVIFLLGFVVMWVGLTAVYSPNNHTVKS